MKQYNNHYEKFCLWGYVKYYEASVSWGFSTQKILPTHALQGADCTATSRSTQKVKGSRESKSAVPEVAPEISSEVHGCG